MKDDATPKTNYLPRELDSKINKFFEGQNEDEKVLIRMKELGEKTNYSDVEDTLTELYNVIGLAKKFKVQLNGEQLSLDNKDILKSSQNEKIYAKLHEVLYSEQSNIQRTSSLQVIKQFMRFFKTEDKGTQTNDSFIENLKIELESKE